MRKDLKKYPYKSAKAHALRPSDKWTRFQQCRSMLERTDPTATLICSDEAHFHVYGTPNRQNDPRWAVTNPRVLHEAPLHSPKLTVFCALSKVGIWGPYFHGEDGVTVTVNQHRYCEMLQQWLQPKVDALREEHEGVELWFQQDGATAHTSVQSIGLVKQMFPGRVVSKRGDVGWPPYSPDLNPCDFFLWGYLKDRVYRSGPNSLEALETAIREEIDNIPLQMCQTVMQAFRDSLQTCIDVRGEHLKNQILKTEPRIGKRHRPICRCFMGLNLT